jgi:hypothetical protein
MGRFTTAIAVMALAVVACTSGATTSTSSNPTTVPSLAVATSVPTAQPATSIATAAPTAKPAQASAPVKLTATVIFDGKACTWKGVRDIPRGTELTMNFVNTPEATKATGGAQFVFGHVSDGVTWDQVLAASGVHVEGYIPKFVDQTELILLTPDNVASGRDSMVHQLLSNQYLMMCFTKTGPATVDPFPAALLYVYDR